MPAGRPSKYYIKITEEPDEGILDLAQVELLNEYGLTDVQMAALLNVTEKTYISFKKKHKQFLQVIKKGKSIADQQVKQSLFKRACGYYYEETTTTNQGETTFIKYEHAHTAAAIYWLNNRDSENWDNKQFIEQKTDVTFPKTVVFQTKPSNGVKTKKDAS